MRRVAAAAAIAAARLLLAKPAVAFLDEATSALDLNAEKKVYEALRRRKRQRDPPITLVSVGHRPSLLQFHTHVLWCERPATATGATAEVESADTSAVGDGSLPTDAIWRWETVESYRHHMMA